MSLMGLAIFLVIALSTISSSTPPSLPDQEVAVPTAADTPVPPAADAGAEASLASDCLQILAAAEVRMRQEVQEAEERGAQREREEGGYGFVAEPPLDPTTPSPTAAPPRPTPTPPTADDYLEPTALPSLLRLRGGRSFPVPLAQAIVTLATSSAYLVGTYALGTSLLRSSSTAPRVLALSPELAADPAVLANATIAGWDYVRPVPLIPNPAIDLGRLRQAHKEDIFTKLTLYGLTDVKHMLFLDADTVIVRPPDHLFEVGADDPPTTLRAVPEISALKHCTDSPAHLLIERNRTFCQSHTKTPYHGRNLTLYNAGVFLLHPHPDTSSLLLSLLAAERNSSDTCLGDPGCNDQRLMNLAFTSPPLSLLPLPLSFNVYCDKYLTVDYGDIPYVLHYRGGEAGKWSGIRTAGERERETESEVDSERERERERERGGGGMKPWIVSPASAASPLTWDAQDMCLHFTSAHLAFEREFIRQRDYEREIEGKNEEEIRSLYLSLRRSADVAYLESRLLTQSRAGSLSLSPPPEQTLRLLDLLRAPDERVRERAAGALTASGFSAATWLHSLSLSHYTLLFPRANLHPASLSLSLSLSHLKDLGVVTET
jgi:hypothetical protein